MFNNKHSLTNNNIIIILIACSSVVACLLFYHNRCLKIIAITWLITQIIKTIITAIKTRRFSFAAYGGMPSSHCAVVSSLTMYFILKLGISNDLIAIPLILLLVVAPDANKVRYQLGLHSKKLNKIFVSDFNQKLNENVGHNIPEIIAGIMTGIICTIILYYFI